MPLPVNCCRLRGATNYRRVVARDDSGALVGTSLYQCSGCSVVFADLRAWRDSGQPDVEGPPRAPDPPRTHPPGPVLAPQAPDLTRYMPRLHGTSR